MNIEALTDIGLSLNEAKIYETLLILGEATVNEISTHSKIHRRNIYDTINRLTEKGLVFQVIGHGDSIYKPVEPNKLMELVQERQKKLEKVLPDLISEYNNKPQLEAVYFYKGIEGFKNYLRDLLISKEDAYFIGAKGAWFDPQLKTFLENFLTQAKKEGITYKHLFDHEVKEKLPEVLKSVGKPYKFLPKDYSTPSMIDIFGDRVVSFTGAGLGKISEDISIFVIISRPMATSYKTWFQFMWDSCPTEK
ncbi:MAG TPA: helix-turn-helix domain-containing protein [Patescibacteria group bacterium]|nr:helix-turn-helix domain-containing protein [Patescibacteria group bacterium]